MPLLSTATTSATIQARRDSRQRKTTGTTTSTSNLSITNLGRAGASNSGNGNGIVSGLAIHNRNNGQGTSGPSLARTAPKRKPSILVLATTSPSPPRPAPSQRAALRAAASALSPHKPPISAAALSPSLSPSAASLSFPRPPLRARDHNVAPASRGKIVLAAPYAAQILRAAPSAAATMRPSDRSGPASKPQVPMLAKGVNKPPLTPKIASARSNTPQPQQPPRQTVTYSTPLTHRTQRPKSAATSQDTPTAVAGGNGPSTADGYTSPPAAVLLGTNVTPRSGARQTRVDSTSNTPTGTPAGNRRDSWESRSGLAISGGEAVDPVRRQVAFSPTPSDSGRSETQQRPAESKFFYASDVKNVSQAQLPQQQAAQLPRPLVAPGPPQQKPSTFFYASDRPVSSRQNVSNNGTLYPALPSPSAGQESLSSKFFYADGRPDVQPPSKPGLSPTGPGSTVSTASRAAGNRGGTSSPAGYPLQRSASPVKLQPHQPQKANGHPNLATTQRNVLASAPQLAHVKPSSRRTSFENPPRASSHSRSGSLTTIPVGEPALAMARLMSPQPTSEASSPGLSVSSNPTPLIPMASLLQAAEDFDDPDEEHDDSGHSDLPSPTKSNHQADQLSELVATARRDRKVQDLEIRNASLEAINRTLERQLRKQTAELRRFRRLSRSGRISVASVTSNRIPSDVTIEGPLANLSDLSEEEESEPENDDWDESDLSNTESATDSESMGHGMMAMRDAKHQKRDERRLQLDLSKHQQLLIDSQKINQSIKRCLSWTEELIKEGQRALAYQVRVSEVEVGGRVLSPLDEDDDEAEAEAGMDPELADGHDDDTVRINVQPSSPWNKEPQDRDSGIELPPEMG